MAARWVTRSSVSAWMILISLKICFGMQQSAVSGDSKLDCKKLGARELEQRLGQAWDKVLGSSTCNEYFQQAIAAEKISDDSVCPPLEAFDACNDAVVEAMMKALPDCSDRTPAEQCHLQAQELVQDSFGKNFDYFP